MTNRQNAINIALTQLQNAILAGNTTLIDSCTHALAALQEPLHDQLSANVVSFDTGTPEFPGMSSDELRKECVHNTCADVTRIINELESFGSDTGENIDAAIHYLKNAESWLNREKQA